MPITVKQLADSVEPPRTVLFFGAGSSVPSGGPTGSALITHLSARFNLTPADFSLSEIASLAEQKTSRKELITALRDILRNLKPTGGLLNLPLYNWRSLFTTNYDDLIEQCYSRRSISLATYSTNFDFGSDTDPSVTKLFKLHGTIDKDVCDGHKSRIILTEADYDQTIDYRAPL
jgi:hypothetical protein